MKTVEQITVDSIDNALLVGMVELVRGGRSPMRASFSRTSRTRGFDPAGAERTR
jgi:hypothetical protein